MKIVDNSNREEKRDFIDHVETCGRRNEFSGMNSTIHQNLATGGGFANLNPKEENVAFSSEQRTRMAQIDRFSCVTPMENKEVKFFAGGDRRC